MMPTGAAAPGHSPPGKAAPHLWEPYKVWVGDLWACKGCGAEIIVGNGAHPLIEHYMPFFEEKRKGRGADEIIVNDC